MTNQTQTLAYQHAKFFKLGAEIANWSSDPEIFVSFPQIVQNEVKDKIYFFTSFGYCPIDSGVLGVFAYDALNDEFCYWCSEDPGWDHEEDALPNLANVNPVRFDDLAALKQFVVTGE